MEGGSATDLVKMGSKAMKIVAISLIWTILGCEMNEFGSDLLR